MCPRMTTEECKVGVLVINLDRRPDRLASISSHLRDLALPFDRIAAIDGSADTVKPNRQEARFISMTQAAVVKSHRKAWHVASNRRHEYTLILEDDTRLDLGVSWNKALPLIASQARKDGIDVLQLGHITFGMRGSVRYWLSELVDQVGERRVRPERWEFTVCGIRHRARLGVFRAGAHGYLVSHKAATMLSDVSGSPLFHIDGLLARLAAPQTFHGALRFGSVCRPLAIQGDSARSQSPDSDNA